MKRRDFLRALALSPVVPCARSTETERALPSDNTYVLAHYNGGNWNDSDDQKGCEWVVAKFIIGISTEEREKLSECKRKHTWKPQDEGFNNERPYYWSTFGPSSFFGQDVDFWCELPNCDEPTNIS